MPSALVAALSEPIREVRALVGWAASADETVSTLARVRDGLDGVAMGAGRSWSATATRWSGAAADAARDFTDTTVAAIDALSQRAERLGMAASAAAEAVARARVTLDRIIEDFEARAAALESRLDDPGTAEELADEAHRALHEATSVVDELSTELDSHTQAVAPPVDPAPTGGGPSGWAGALGPGAAAGSGFGSIAGSALRPATGDGLGASSRAPSGAPIPTADPATFGSGEVVQLPGGATAIAPNAVAASAVRHALTQLGVPYDWGGTAPGVGLDCSGLTQWAYHEAGLELPRLAQEQDIGAAVGRDSLRPGDLAVWDGHVAMIVGDGLMIEAGDPVKLSPVRTTNAGQGFQGFWRPTA